MLQRKLLLVPLLCLSGLFTACIIAFGYLAQDWKLDYFEKELNQSLTRITANLNQDKPEATLKSLQTYVQSQSLVNQHQRLTFIDNDGRVLADSNLGLAAVKTMDNHNSREEVKEAVANGLGVSVRHSSTLNSNLIYVAKPVQFGEFNGVVRLAVPLAHAENFVFQLQLFLAGLMFIVLLIMTTLAGVTHKVIRRDLKKRQGRLSQDVEERTKEIELLQRLANMLAACNSIEEAQQVVADIIPRIIGDVNGSVAMMRSSRNQLEVKLDWGGEWPSAKSYAPDECWALRKGKYHLSQDKYGSLPCSHMEGIGDHHCLCIPLIAHGNTIGIMHIDMADKPFDDEHMQLAFTVGEHLGLALANLDLQEKLREQAIRDPLTGLHNRRYLEECMPQEMMRAKRHGQPLSVLMLDMDHFKLFNDNFGHDAGDYVLKSLASLLNDCLRGEDTSCRIGGEEMAVLLPATDALAAGVVAKRLCEEVRKLALSFRGQSLGNLTLSIGVACNSDGSTAEDMLKQADMALYEAKDKGRNQYRYANNLLHEQEAEYLADLADHQEAHGPGYIPRQTPSEKSAVDDNPQNVSSLKSVDGTDPS